jgi:hypothetical protein
VSSSTDREAKAPQVAVGPSSTNPYKSPTYPPRVHFGERQDLEVALQSCEAKLATVSQKLTVLGKNARRLEYERAYFQLLGARDQVAECVRRMPLETAALYHEDKERLDEALKAFGRVFKKWDVIQ